MKKRFRFLAVFPVVFVFLLFFHSVPASAALTGGRYLSPQEALQVFGNSFECKYWNGSNYSSISLTYSGTFDSSSNGMACDNSNDYLNSRPNILIYSGSYSGFNSDRNYISVDLSPLYSIFDTEQLHTCIFFDSQYSTASGGFVPDVYQSPTWEWVIGGQLMYFNNPNAGNGYQTEARFDGRKWLYVPVSYTSASTFSGYSQRACFWGNFDSSGTFKLGLSCPYISTNSTASAGTFVTSGSGSSGSGTNTGTNSGGSVDMTQTNGLLSTVISTISQSVNLIISGIERIFIPDPNVLQDEYDALIDRFDWIQDAKEDIEAMFVAFNSPPENVPSVDADLGVTFYGQTLSGSSSVLNLSWFAPYRSTVRGILRAFIWLFFLWRVYCHLPSIIRGGSMDVLTLTNSISGGD